MIPAPNSKVRYVGFAIAAFTALVALLGSLNSFTLIPLLMSLVAPALLATAIWRPWTMAICGGATLLLDAVPWTLVLIRGDVEWLGPALLLFPILLTVCLIGSTLDYLRARKLGESPSSAT